MVFKRTLIGRRVENESAADTYNTPSWTLNDSASRTSFSAVMRATAPEGAVALLSAAASIGCTNQTKKEHLEVVKQICMCQPCMQHLKRRPWHNHLQHGFHEVCDV